jgi:hypothetical protein
VTSLLARSRDSTPSRVIQGVYGGCLATRSRLDRFGFPRLASALLGTVRRILRFVYDCVIAERVSLLQSLYGVNTPQYLCSIKSGCFTTVVLIIVIKMQRNLAVSLRVRSGLLLIHSSYTVLLLCRGFHFYFGSYTVGRTPWSSDRPVTRPLPKYGVTQTQNKRAHTSNMHALSGIRTKDHCLRESEDSS